MPRGLVAVDMGLDVLPGVEGRDGGNKCYLDHFFRVTHTHGRHGRHGPALRGRDGKNDLRGGSPFGWFGWMHAEVRRVSECHFRDKTERTYSDVCRRCPMLGWYLGHQLRSRGELSPLHARGPYIFAFMCQDCNNSLTHMCPQS